MHVVTCVCAQRTFTKGRFRDPADPLLNVSWPPLYSKILSNLQIATDARVCKANRPASVLQCSIRLVWGVAYMGTSKPQRLNTSLRGFQRKTGEWQGRTSEEHEQRA
eukprot:1137764-Pelagomonas_calceolata.AAC.2